MRAQIWVTWVFFRAPSFHDAWTITAAMQGMDDARGTVVVRSYVQLMVWVSLLLTLRESRNEQGLKAGIQRWGQLHFTVRGTTYAGMALAIIFFGGSSQKFIYFDY